MVVTPRNRTTIGNISPFIFVLLATLYCMPAEAPAEDRTARPAVTGTGEPDDPPQVNPDRVLRELESAIEKDLSSYALASEYRARCAEYGMRDRSIDFFERLARKRPESNRVRVEWACAYVDKIPTCSGVTAFISRGTLARKSLDQLNKVLKRKSDSWEALYCRAMNHLHWPRALRHSDDAVEDFLRCIELQDKDPKRSEKPYYLRTHVGLGDAHTKAKQYDAARKAWRQGLERFPDAKDLKDRLAISDNGDLLDFVESVRNLEQAIDTSLSFLQEKRPAEMTSHGMGTN